MNELTKKKNEKGICPICEGKTRAERIESDDGLCGCVDFHWNEICSKCGNVKFVRDNIEEYNKEIDELDKMKEFVDFYPKIKYLLIKTDSVSDAFKWFKETIEFRIEKKIIYLNKHYKF